ncbi:MAG: hypothetical protein ABI467_01015 [Kofleriaceae bacterium]
MRPLVLAVLLLAPLPGRLEAAPHKKAPRAPRAATTPSVAPEASGDAPIALNSGAPHAEGDYSGVTPGIPPKTTKPKRPPAKGTLSWIGFEAKDGGAELFFQSVAPFEVAQHVDHGALVVDLGGLDKLGQNTWRAVDARFFDSPLARITARRVGAVHGKNAHRAGVEVRITFKNAKDAREGTVRSATEADGMYYQYLSFAGTGSSATVPATPDPEK